MPVTQVAKLAFNRGLVSKLGLARSDVKRLAMAAQVQTNWISRVLGSMTIRPGLAYLFSTLGDAIAQYIEFIFAIDDKALIELTDGALRVVIADVVITRPSVASAVANGAFTTDLTSWTDADEAGATSAWQTGGYLGLTGNGTAFAIRRQQVTVAGGDQGVEHALHVVIDRGPVILRVGSTAADDDYIAETELATGVHSLAFTPTGDFHIDLKSRLLRIVLVDSIAVEAAGDMVVETPWTVTELTAPSVLRWDASADVIFVAWGGRQQRIERRAARSWSCVDYLTSDGPFRILNVSPTTISASAITGNVTLTASKPLFKSTQVGALFQMVSEGQTVSVSVTAENTFSSTIRVTGSGTVRGFSVSRTGTWVATVTLQRSFDEGVSWIDVTTYTTNATVTFTDGLDNQDVLYRIGVKTGDFTSGTVELTLAITTGSITGVVRVTAFTSSTSVAAEVITALGGTTATPDWAEGRWSDYRGFPTAVGFHEGRLCWSGKDQMDLSISDAFDGFDAATEGDSAPISRSIGSGAVDTISWMLSLQRLLLGGALAEFSIRASSLDEPLTPTNFNLKRASTQGSSRVGAIKIDQRGVFVQRGGLRVYELAFGADGIDYEANHLSALVPTIGSPQIVKIAVQRQPDTRVHCLRSDGTVGMLIFDKVEEVICWVDVTTDGSVEDVIVLPGDAGDEDDWVYYVVQRTINSVTKRYLEKWAFESECKGDATLCKLADSFVIFTNGPASATVTGLTHLVAESVIVWADSKCLTDANGDIATFTVSGAGEITLTNGGVSYSATTGVVGLAYSASFQSAKLVELAQVLGSQLSDTQLIRGLSLILADVHAKGLKYGRTLTASEMRDLPEIVDGAAVDADTVRSEYTMDKSMFPGQWSQDERICLLGQAPRPCTVLAALAEVEHHG